MEDLVQRRLRYIDRQKALHKDAVNVAFEGQSPVGSGPKNRDGMPQLPVGQHEVRNWPVLDLGDVPQVSREAWRLEIGGMVHNPVVLDWAAFMALPQADD